MVDISAPVHPIPYSMTAAIRIGTQGWNYDSWVGPFYPLGTRAVDFLRVYARAFDTVEVDATFYGTPAARTLQNWAASVPAGFRFALKLPREITHEAGLRNPEASTAFFDRIRELGDRLGPVLVQLAPEFGPSELPALAAFLPTLPRDLHVAIEFRHRGWVHDGVIALLAEHNVALALVDARWIPRRTMLALAERPTADFAYIRWMGPDRDIVDYSRTQVDRTREIDAWAGVMPDLIRRPGGVYAYVNNHFAGHAPATARQLQRRLQLPVTEPAQLGEQLSLF